MKWKWLLWPWFFTLYFWRLSGDQKWDVLSALRGPDDVENESFYILKHHITCRLRAIVVRDGAVGFLPRNDFVMTAADMNEVLKELRTSAYWPRHHFRVHLHIAVESTQDHPLWGGYAQTLIQYL